MDKKKCSGNVSGNVFQSMPQQDAEYEPNHSIPSLQTHKSIGIAHGSIQHSNAQLTYGQIAAHCTTAPAVATVLATIGGAL